MCLRVTRQELQHIFHRLVYTAEIMEGRIAPRRPERPSVSFVDPTAVSSSSRTEPEAHEQPATDAAARTERHTEQASKSPKSSTDRPRPNPENDSTEFLAVIDSSIPDHQKIVQHFTQVYDASQNRVDEHWRQLFFATMKERYNKKLLEKVRKDEKVAVQEYVGRRSDAGIALSVKAQDRGGESSRTRL